MSEGAAVNENRGQGRGCAPRVAKPLKVQTRRDGPRLAEEAGEGLTLEKHWTVLGSCP